MEHLEYYQQTLENTLGIPFTPNNHVEVLKNGVEIYPAMLKAIENAQRRIDFLTFIYWSGDIAYHFARALSKKAHEGTGVRVILDSFGAALMPDELTDLMEGNGVKIEWFRPIPQWKIWKTDHRTHRKVLICDGDVAFTGGVGIAEEWEGDARNPDEWRETHFEIQGPAVFGLHAAFMENWLETEKSLELERNWGNKAAIKEVEENRVDGSLIQVIRTSASVRWSNIVMLYHTLISLAKRRIRITTAYFNPDEAIVELLKNTARRGVDIEIMMPGRHIDKRVAEIAGGDHLLPLLKAGVNFWYYHKTMLHSKIICIDDVACCVGSANFNHRSMLKDDEVSLVIIDEKLAETLNSHFEEDLGHCERITEKSWENRSTFRKGLETLTRLFRQEV